MSLVHGCLTVLITGLVQTLVTVDVDQGQLLQCGDTERGLCVCVCERKVDLHSQGHVNKYLFIQNTISADRVPYMFNFISFHFFRL